MKKIIYMLYLILIIILMGELILYFFPSIASKNPPYNTAIIDEELGWKAKANYHFKGTMYSLDKSPYEINVSTDSYGFRSRKEESGKKNEQKIMIIGDSFTQAVEVSNDKTYYS